MKLNTFNKTQIIPSLTSRSFFRLTHESFWHDLSFHVIWCIKVIHACLVHFLLKPGINYFFKNPWFIFMRIVFKHHNLGPTDACSLEWSLFLGRFISQSWETHRHTFTYIHIYIYTHTHIKIICFVNLYWYFQIKLKTMRFCLLSMLNLYFLSSIVRICAFLVLRETEYLLITHFIVLYYTYTSLQIISFY